MSAQIPKSYLSVEQFLDLAIGFEQESAEFYRSMRQGSADSKVLDLLGDLEQQEREHERALGEYKKDHHSQAVLQFAPDFRFAMPAASGSPGFSEMLEVAIERERQSVLIYQSAADLSGGDFRGILEELAAFEKQHLERLSGIRRRSKR